MLNIIKVTMLNIIKVTGKNVEIRKLYVIVIKFVVDVIFHGGDAVFMIVGQM